MMIGAIVGVGVFGLPWRLPKEDLDRASSCSFWVGFWSCFELMLGEIVAQTPGHHRLVNYIRIYTGRFWKWVTLVALSLGVWGAMLAYMLVGGTFCTFLPLAHSWRRRGGVFLRACHHRLGVGIWWSRCSLRASNISSSAPCCFCLLSSFLRAFRS